MHGKFLDGCIFMRPSQNKHGTSIWPPFKEGNIHKVFLPEPDSFGELSLVSHVFIKIKSQARGQKTLIGIGSACPTLALCAPKPIGAAPGINERAYGLV